MPPSDGLAMPSAFDLIGHNPALQEHWIRRFIAFVIDAVIVEVLVWAAQQGDPPQPLFDRIARTPVARVDQGAYMEEQFRMMQHAGPHPMTMPPAPAPQAPPPAPPGAQAASATPAQGGWPGQAPPPSGGWPQHSWDEQGRLVREMKFCTACAGQLVARGDGRLTCVRCGAVY